MNDNYDDKIDNIPEEINKQEDSEIRVVKADSHESVEIEPVIKLSESLDEKEILNNESKRIFLKEKADKNIIPKKIERPRQPKKKKKKFNIIKIILVPLIIIVGAILGVKVFNKVFAENKQAESNINIPDNVANVSSVPAPKIEEEKTTDNTEKQIEKNINTEKKIITATQKDNNFIAKQDIPAYLENKIDLSGVEILFDLPNGFTRNNIQPSNFSEFKYAAIAWQTASAIFTEEKNSNNIAVIGYPNILNGISVEKDVFKQFIKDISGDFDGINKIELISKKGDNQVLFFYHEQIIDEGESTGTYITSPYLALNLKNRVIFLSSNEAIADSNVSELLYGWAEKVLGVNSISVDEKNKVEYFNNNEVEEKEEKDINTSNNSIQPEENDDFDLKSLDIEFENTSQIIVNNLEITVPIPGDYEKITNLSQFNATSPIENNNIVLTSAYGHSPEKRAEKYQEDYQEQQYSADQSTALENLKYLLYAYNSSKKIDKTIFRTLLKTNENQKVYVAENDFQVVASEIEGYLQNTCAVVYVNDNILILAINSNNFFPANIEAKILEKWAKELLKVNKENAKKTDPRKNKPKKNIEKPVRFVKYLDFKIAGQDIKYPVEAGFIVRSSTLINDLKEVKSESVQIATLATKRYSDNPTYTNESGEGQEILYDANLSIIMYHNKSLIRQDDYKKFLRNIRGGIQNDPSKGKIVSQGGNYILLNSNNSLTLITRVKARLLRLSLKYDENIDVKKLEKLFDAWGKAIVAANKSSK